MKKILAAIDGSEYSLKGVRSAAELASSFGAKLTLASDRPLIPHLTIERFQMIAPTSDAPFPKSVQRLLIQRLAADHPKLESTLKDVAVQVERRFFDSAGKRFAEFRTKHERHIIVEEDVLFPVCESLTTDWETIAEMKQTHQILRQLIDDAQSAISGWDGERFKKAYRDLLDALATHVMQEVVFLAEDLDSCLYAEDKLRPADGSVKLSS